jgi:hypothetical protein
MHLVKRKSKTKTTELASGLTERQADCLPPRPNSECLATDVTRMSTKTSKRSGANAASAITRIHRAQSIGCKISKGRGTAAWWTQDAVIRPDTGGV